MKTQFEVKRNSYNEINLMSLPENIRRQVAEYVNTAAKADKIDEHGSWDFGVDFDKKGRGSALNWDLYGIGVDHFSEELLIVIQIRQFIRRRKNGFGNVRKSYFLIGKNEDGRVFAHAVESRVIHAAIRKGADVILSVQNWIFDCDYTKVIRQGDLAMIPVKKAAAPQLETEEYVIEHSHKLTADEIRLNGSLYAKNPHLFHMPQTHPEVRGTGWFKIVVGNRAKFWDFAAPTID